MVLFSWVVIISVVVILIRYIKGINNAYGAVRFLAYVVSGIAATYGLVFSLMFLCIKDIDTNFLISSVIAFVIGVVGLILTPILHNKKTKKEIEISKHLKKVFKCNFYLINDSNDELKFIYDGKRYDGFDEIEGFQYDGKVLKSDLLKCKIYIRLDYSKSYEWTLNNKTFKLPYVSNLSIRIYLRYVAVIYALIILAAF